MSKSLRHRPNKSNREDSDTYIPEVVGTLSDGAHHGGGSTDRTPTREESFPVWPEVSMPLMQRDYKGPRNYQDGGLQNAVVTGGSFDGPICFSAKDHGADAAEDISPTLRTGGFTESHENAGVMPAVAYPILEAGARTGTSTDDVRCGMGVGESDDPMFTLQSGKQHAVGTQMAVRRLTPVECARLQSFPDDWLDVDYRGKPATDGHKYRALGNAVTVNTVEWIAKRIASQPQEIVRVLDHVDPEEPAIP